MTPPAFDLAILFTGHMIDAPGRAVPRLPARAEAAARAEITRILSALPHQNAMGIAGGASGGDILFHEACLDLAIPTRLYLALPPDEYLAASVAPAGPEWVRRFHALLDRLPPEDLHILDDTIVLPPALTGGEDLNIWARVNLWMVSEALTAAPQRTLIALWDGNPGDGPGGTEHLVTAAPTFGIDVAPPIRTQSLIT
jgi:hypothetical protein